LSLRIHINALVNDHTSPMQYEDILPLHDKIMQHLEDLPRWPDSNSSSYARMLLDIQLRQHLLLLHGPFAQRRGCNSRHDYSRTVCLNAASSLINQHAKLTESGNFVPTMFRQDVLRAGLSISHNVFLSTLSPGKPFLKAHFELKKVTVLNNGPNMYPGTGIVARVQVNLVV